MQQVFKALADESRRQLLDRLHEQDGLTLNELCAGMSITRQAVTKHLSILQQANLVVVMQKGRFRHHYLNPVPLQEIMDRWVDKYLQHQASALTALKRSLESNATHLEDHTMTELNHVCVIYINASPEKVWQGLTSPAFTERYFHQTRVESEWTEGATVTYYNPDDSVAVLGEVLRVDYPRMLSFTWHVHYDDAAKSEGPTRVTFTLDEVESATKLTMRHDQFMPESVLYPRISEGWIAILSNLKTLLETGDVMAVS